MHRTPFAGLTAPDPNDPITVDGGTFVTRNPDLIDHFLRIGAVTHRHDGHPAMPNPQAPPSASVQASGGSIGPGASVYLGYTVTDQDGGETVISPVVNVSTPAGYGAPSGVITASADYSAGGLMAGNYYYAKSNIDAGGGETPIGPMVQVTRQPGYASGQILLAGLAADLVPGGPVAWHLWRSQDGQFLTLIASGTSDAFTDAGANCMQGADPTYQPPQIDTTRGANSIACTLPSADVAIQSASAAQINLYLSTDGAFANPSLYGVYPVASAGATILIPNLIVSNGEPPEVSTSIGGANPIVSSEIGDLQWLPPVHTASALPANPRDGDARLAIDTRTPWFASGGVWGTTADVDPGGGGGAGSISQVGTQPPGTGSVSNPGAIIFAPASGTVISVAASGGSAVVTIGASGTQGPAGPAGAAGPPGAGLNAVSPSGASATGVVVPTPSAVNFAGSGAAHVDVAQIGGSAVVTITAIPGVGPAGASGAPGATGPAGPAGAGGGAAIGSAISFASASAGVYASAYGSPPGATWVQAGFDNFADLQDPPQGWTNTQGTVKADTGFAYPGATDGSPQSAVWTGGPTVRDKDRVTASLTWGAGSQQVGVGAPYFSTGAQGVLHTRLTNVDTFEILDGYNGNTLATTPFTPVAGTTYWLRLIRNGNSVTAQVFTSDPTPGGVTAAATLNTTLTGAAATALGVGTAGPVWMFFRSGSSGGSQINWVRVETSPDTRHNEERVWTNGASGLVDRRLIDDMGRSDFLADVFASGASATGQWTRDIDALIVQGSGAASVNLASAVSPNASKTPGASAAVITVTSLPGAPGPPGASGAPGPAGPAGSTTGLASASANVPPQAYASGTSITGPFSQVTVQGSGAVKVGVASAAAPGGGSAAVIMIDDQAASFRAHGSVTLPNGAIGTVSKVAIDTLDDDSRGGWDAPNHRYIVQVPGIYMLHTFWASTTGTNDTAAVDHGPYVNGAGSSGYGSNISRIEAAGTAAGVQGPNLVVVRLNKGDAVEFYGNCTQAGQTGVATLAATKIAP